ncbi:MAG: DnaA/Hda family protein, partial [Limnobacter sp.]|nr:DnaA/Hda family protein [Limnobacter sp.]
PRQTLGNFLTGENAQVVHSLKQLKSKGLIHSPFLYLWGTPGCGKTHLLKGSAGLVGERLRSGKDRFVFKEGPQALFIDDVQKLTAFSQVQLFNAFNTALNGGLPKFIVLAGNKAASELPVREDLRTRIESGLCMRVAPLSEEDKMQALQRIARSRGLQLSTEVVDYALRHFQRDMGSLTALLDGLDRFSLEQKKPVSVHLLRHWMRRRESLVVKEHETRAV